MRAKFTGYIYKPHKSATKRVCDMQNMLIWTLKKANFL